VKDLGDRKQHVKIIDRISNERDTATSSVLDTVIVGCRANIDKIALRERRAKDVVSFTQQIPSSTIGGNQDVKPSAQLEVVDFVIWLLFKRSPSHSRPQHLLSQGFDRQAAKGQHGLQLSAVPGIPGIICQYSNPHIETVVSPAWCHLLSSLGEGGDVVMVDLLLECCLFIPIGDNTKSLKQFSGTNFMFPCLFANSDGLVGVPLSSLQPSVSLPGEVGAKPGQHVHKAPFSRFCAMPRQPSSIKFVRNRMFFAQPSMSAANKIKFGLHTIRKMTFRYDLSRIFAHSRRCPQSIYRCAKSRRDRSLTEVHLSSTIPPAQCVHICGRFSRISSAV